MASTKAGFAQHDAGVLVNGKLSKTAENKFIDDLQNELMFGSIGVPGLFPCLPQLEPVGFANIDLHDREKYGELYSQGLKNYEAIALALDVKGARPFFPIIFDPIAFAYEFGLDIPDLPFPELFIPFPDFIVPDFWLELPQPFPPTPPIPLIPTLNIPKIQFDISLPELNLFFAWYLKLPDLFLNLAMQMPNIAIKIPALDFKPFCEAVRDAKLFGDADPSLLTRVAINKVLANKTGECLVIAAIAATMGSSDKGITGGMGTTFEVKDPEKPPPGSGKTILAVAGIEKTTPAFRRRLYEIATELKIEPDWLAAVISLESNKTFSASVQNPLSGAVGLIQFLGSTAISIGTTKTALVGMTALEQLEYVKKYFVKATNNGKIKLRTIEDVYLTVFYPVAVGKSLGAVVIDQATSPTEYAQNKGFDKDNDGKITKAEIAGSINGVVFSAKKKRISTDNDTISLHRA